jgi:hypothetical protein
MGKKEEERPKNFHLFFPAKKKQKDFTPSNVGLVVVVVIRCDVTLLGGDSRAVSAVSTCRTQTSDSFRPIRSGVWP